MRLLHSERFTGSPGSTTMLHNCIGDRQIKIKAGLQQTVTADIKTDPASPAYSQGHPA